MYNRARGEAMKTLTHAASTVILSVFVSGIAFGFQTLNPVTKDPNTPKGLIRLSTSELEASAITRVEANIPSIAAWAGVSADDVVMVLIDHKGEVIKATSYAHPLVRNALTTAARGWKFKPAERDGKPVKVTGTIRITVPEQNVPSRSANSHDDEDALETAKTAVQLFPSSPEAYFWLATEYEDDEQNQEALKALKTAIEMKHDYEEAYLELISLYQRSRATEDVLRTYQQATENIPNSCTLLAGRATALGADKKFAESVDVIKRAIEINPDENSYLRTLAWAYIQLRRFEDALATINEQLKLDDKEPSTYHNLGWTDSQLKRYDDAIAAYQKIIDMKSSYPQLNKVYHELAYALLQNNRIPESIDAFNHVIEMKTDLSGLYCGLAAAYLRASREEEAVEALKKGVAEKPKESCLYDSLGALSMRAGKLQEAESYFRKSIDVNPSGFQGYGNLASLLVRQQKSVEAQAVLSDAIKKLPDNVMLRTYLGSLQANSNKWNEAEAQFKEVLRLDPNNAMALNDYGYYLAERNERLNEALDMIQRAVNASPDNPSFLDSLGWVYFKLGRLEEAERYLTRALQRTSAPAIYEHVGDLYEKQGRHDSATEMWQKAVSMKPSADMAARLKTKLNAGDQPKQQ